MPFRALIDACWKEKYTASRFTRSGPTAAFVVILYPVSQQFGLAGLLVATLMSGFFLILFGLARLGRLIEYIPVSVTLGFTSGIGITIGTMQIKDFLGLQMAHVPEHYLQKVGAGNVATIGSQFHYVLADGTQGNGIPQLLPQLMLPWSLPGSDFTLSWDSLRALLPAAFSMAMLGAIESLLCAVVLDGMTGTKHKANSELIGQGLGNMVAAAFRDGGATADGGMEYE